MPLEMRPFDLSVISTSRTRLPEQAIWMRASGELRSDLFALHQCISAYASDFTLLDTSLIAHGKLMFDQDMQMASLDQRPLASSPLPRRRLAALRAGQSVGAGRSSGRA